MKIHPLLVWSGSFFAFLALLVLLLLLSPSALGYVGCFEDGDLWFCDNGGGIAPLTILNESSGFIQYANSYTERLGDVTYSMGMARKILNTYIYYGTTDLNGPTSLSYDSDHWEAHVQKSVSLPLRTMQLTKLMEQEDGADMIDITVSAYTTKNTYANHYFANALHDIDVGRDGIADQTVISDGENITEFWGNVNTTQFYYNVERLLIANEYTYRLEFADPVLVIVTPGSVNPDFYVLSYIGNMNAGQNYTFSYQWIDAGCTITCAMGSYMYVESNTSGFDVYVDQGEVTRQTFCKPAKSGTCSVSGCYLNQCAYNPRTGTWDDITRDVVDLPVRCAQPNCHVAIGLSFLWVARSVTGLSTEANGELNYRCYIDDPAGCSGPTHLGGDGSYYVVGEVERNVTLFAPPDGTLFNSSMNWANFSCGSEWANGIVDADNGSIILSNQTIPYYTAEEELNITVNLTIDETVDWTCQYCYGNSCYQAWNGYWTVIFFYVPIINELSGIDNEVVILLDDKVSCNFLCRIIRAFTKLAR